MKNSRFKLAITEAAYYAVLDAALTPELTNPLPVLKYNIDTGTCNIFGRNSKGVDMNLVHQVGRINFVIEDQELLVYLNGKTLDYINGEFVIL